MLPKAAAAALLASGTRAMIGVQYALSSVMLARRAQ
jgi:hypothetical protein